MIYVKQDEYTARNICPSVMWEDYLPDGGMLTLYLPRNWVIQIIQFEHYFTGQGQTILTMNHKKVYKPRYFISPGQNFWNIKYFYVNAGVRPDTSSTQSADIVLYINSASDMTYYGTFAVLGLLANSEEGNNVYG